jgi:hypothetical protein
VRAGAVGLSSKPVLPETSSPLQPFVRLLQRRFRALAFRDLFGRGEHEAAAARKRLSTCRLAGYAKSDEPTRRLEQNAFRSQGHRWKASGPRGR